MFRYINICSSFTNNNKGHNDIVICKIHFSSIDTVRLSNINPQVTSISSESIQLSILIDTGDPHSPTS